MKKAKSDEAKKTVLNREKGLLRVAGDEALFKELLKSFREEWEGWWDEMESALEADESGEVMRYAHTIKGSADTIGADEVTAKSRQIEALARSEEMEEVREALPGLGRALERLDKQMAIEID